MVTVKVEDVRNPSDDPKKDREKALEIALRKFSKELEKECVLESYKEKLHYTKPSAKKHKQKRLLEHKQKLGKK